MRRGVQAPMAAPKGSPSRMRGRAQAAGSTQARGFALEAGWGRGCVPFWIAGSRSLLWNVWSLFAAPTPFLSAWLDQTQMALLPSSQQP